MASLRRSPNSPFWIACFTLPDGRRTNRSTGTHDKRQAQRIAAQFEDAAQEAITGRFTETRARKTIADIFAMVNKQALASSTIEDFIEAWLKRKELEAGEAKILPLAAPLLNHLESLPARDDPTAPLFPKVCAARGRSQYGGTISNQFYGILVAAGLAKPRPHKSIGKGRDTKRDLGGLSFHCLRHTATSLLKNAGVSDAVAQDIIGHDSAAVSAAYTHIDMATKRKAIDSIPDISTP